MRIQYSQTMLKYTDKNGNTIYSHKHPAKLNIYIEFRGVKGCTIYLAEGAISIGCTNIVVIGDNATVFVGRVTFGECSIILLQNCTCYIGNETTMAPRARAQRLRIFAPDTNLFIGDDCMFSENIEITTTDAHVIYDVDSGRRVNDSRSVFIGDHVWLGRTVSVLKGSRMASGGILGFGSILTGKYCPPNSTNAGIPAQILGTRKFWVRKEVGEVATPQERQVGIFEYEEEASIRPCDIEHTMKSLATSHERISFLYDFLYLNSAHNRFAWNEEAATACGERLLPYKNSFEQHVAGVTPVKEKWESPVAGELLFNDERARSNLLSLALQRYSIWYQYCRCKVMCHISWGRRKRKYKEKKAHYRYLLRRIKAFKMITDAISR